MSSSEDPKRGKPPDDPNLGLDSSNPQGSAGSDQQHNPDPDQASLEVSQPVTLATTTVSQTSTTATTTVSQDTKATIIVSQNPAMATTTVSLQTTATSTEGQSTIGHVTVSPSTSDTSQPTGSILTEARGLEAVTGQASLENITAVPQGPVIGDVLATDTPSDPQGSAYVAA